MDNRVYINDFCEDLNHRNIILYIGNVGHRKLLKALERSLVNKTYRLTYALHKSDADKLNFIYVENCDLQDLDYPLYEYIQEGYNVCVLYEEDNRFYIKPSIILDQ